MFPLIPRIVRFLPVTEILLAILTALALVAFANWRLGLAAAVLAAFFQDLLRKITPHQPVVYVVIVAGVFAFACLGAIMRGVSLSPRKIHGWQRNVGISFVLFVFIVLFQALFSYLRYDNIMLPAIGLLSYLTPFPAIAFAYQLAVRGGMKSIDHFLITYVAMMTIAAATIYLEFAGVASPFFGQVGKLFVLNDVLAISGVLRSAEVAGWHAATAASAVILLGTARNASNLRKVLSILLLLFLVVASVLTGRRKMLFLVVIFACGYFGLNATFQKGGIRQILSTVVLATAVLIGILFIAGVDISSLTSSQLAYHVYVERTENVFSESLDRFTTMVIDPMSDIYEHFGVFGAGLGVSSQGTQYFGGGTDKFFIWGAEGGIGKLVLELGIPGAIIAAMFGIVFCRYIWRSVQHTRTMSSHMARFSYGLLAVLVANAAEFSVSAAVYADPFILLVLGSMVGFLLAMPVLAVRERSCQPSEQQRRSYLTQKQLAVTPFRIGGSL